MTAHSALYHTEKMAGGGPSVHACEVFLGAKSRHGDKFNQTPTPPCRLSDLSDDRCTVP